MGGDATLRGEGRAVEPAAALHRRARGAVDPVLPSTHLHTTKRRQGAAWDRWRATCTEKRGRRERGEKEPVAMIGDVVGM